MDRERLWYVYYSYEQWGRGYIGIRKCNPKLTPETDPYWGLTLIKVITLQRK